MENPPAHFPAWPGDAEVAVALTFDVDGRGYLARIWTAITGMAGRGRPWFATHAQIANLADGSPSGSP